jgi:hypothetical protein
MSCVKIFCFHSELSTSHTGFLTCPTWGIPVPVPIKTHTLSTGTGFCQVALKYLRVHDNPTGAITVLGLHTVTIV